MPSRLPHLGVARGALPRYAFLCGDPFRVPAIASIWDSASELAFTREFRTMQGVVRGTAVIACSHGIGSSSAEIAVVELAAAGVDTFIRIGSCAALQPEIRPGDLVVATGAMRLGGAADDYVARGYPALAHHRVLDALIRAAEERRARHHVGVAASADSFYAGQGRMLPSPFDRLQAGDPGLPSKLGGWGLKNFEMEGATIMTLASLMGLRAGMICVAGPNRITGDQGEASFALCIEVALAAMLTLAEADNTAMAGLDRHERCL